MAISKEALLKPRIPEREVEIDGVGTVRVRGLSRSETIRLHKFGKDDFDSSETFMLARGMVDPALDEHEAREWRTSAPPAELEPVVNAICELSGLLDGSLRDAVDTFHDGAGDADGLPPGSGVEDDGGAPPGGDE